VHQGLQRQPPERVPLTPTTALRRALWITPNAGTLIAASLPAMLTPPAEAAEILRMQLQSA